MRSALFRLKHVAHRNYDQVSACAVAKMIRRIFLRLIMSVLIITFLAGAAPAEQKTPTLMVPSDEALVIMIKTILVAYNQANVTGNYSVLRDLAAPIFRETNSSARLAEIFQDMRRKNIDISLIVLVQPKLVDKPRIDNDGDLILQGFFDTPPERVKFLLVFRVNGVGSYSPSVSRQRGSKTGRHCRGGNCHSQD
jgi:hypothetical protein